MSWSLADLAAGASRVITFRATAPVTAGTTVTNTASVASATFDPVTANNTASVATRVISASMSIEKIARPEIVAPGGGAVTFEFVVRNTGTVPLTDVVVTDNPDCTSLTGPTGDLDHVPGKPRSLAPPSNGVDTEIWRYTCTRTVTTATPDVAASSGGLTAGVPPLDTSVHTKQDVVQVTAKDPINNTVSALAARLVTISNPSISVTKTLSPPGQRPAPGGRASFEVAVTNTGNVPLVNVATTDIWAGSCNAGSIPTLAPGAVYRMTCDATLPASGITDDFGTGTPYSYSTGAGWVSGWVDSQDNNPAAGEVFVTDAAAAGLPAGHTAPNVLRYGGNGRTLTRQVSLAGRTTATLRLSYHRTAAYNGLGRDLWIRWSSNGTTFTRLAAVPRTGVSTADSGWSTLEVPAPSGGWTATTYIQVGDTTVDLNNSGRTVYLDDVAFDEVNSVTATARDAYGTQVTATATAAVTPGTPSLSITKAASRTTLRADDDLVYTVTVTNTSNVRQTGITVADALPTNLAQTATASVTRPRYWFAQDDFGTGQSYTTGTGWAGGWTETGDGATSPTAGRITVVTNAGNPPSSLYFDPNNLPYTIARPVNLAGATTAQLRFDCSREAPNSAPDQVVVSVGGQTVHTIGLGSSTVDCPTTNGTSWGTVTVPVPAAALVNNALVQLTATGDKKFRFDNIVLTGSAPASTVNAGPPPNLTAAGGNLNGSTTDFALDAGASMTFTIPVRVTAAPTDGYQFSNTASTTSSQQPFPVAASVVTPYLAPGYSITKAAIETWVNGSGTVTYRIELRNTGNVALSSVVVGDPSCSAAPTLVAGDLNSDGRLQLGEVWRYQCTRTVAAPLSTASPPSPVVVPNTATATANDGISGTTVGARTASAEVRVVHPAIGLTVSPASVIIPSGSTVAYTYTVANTGDIGIYLTTPTATNCSPLAYQSGDDNGDGILNTTERWTYTCTTSAITANQTGTVSVSGADRIFGSAVTASRPVDVSVTPPLVLTKTATDSTSSASGNDITVGVNNSIRYTYTLRNPSATPAVGLPLANVKVTDDTCAPVTPVTAAGRNVGDTANVGLLDPGETWSFECVGGTLASTTTNTAFGTGDYVAGGGGTVSSNAARATVTVRRPLLVLGKEASSESVRTGNPVTFTFLVTNIGGTSFNLTGPSSLGAPSDWVVAADGTLTTTPACGPISGPRFYSRAGNTALRGDVNGNGILDPGETAVYTCTTAVTADTVDAFRLGASTDRLGGTTTPDPAQAQVFAIDPGFAVAKYAETSLGGPGINITGVPGGSVTYTFEVTHTTPVTGTYRDQLNSLTMTLTEPAGQCTTPSQPAFVSGDPNGNGLLDPGEVWRYTCTLSSLPDGSPTVNTVTAVASVPARDLDPDGNPENPADGLGDITRTASATVSPSTKAITVLKRATNCDVGQPVCANTLSGTAFKVYASDPATGNPTGTPLTNSPSGSATFTSGQLVVNNQYWLVETSAPQGFQLLAEPIRFHLSGSGVTLVSGSSSLITANAFTITVTDVPAARLPRAGGNGFRPFAALGLLLVAGACCAYAWSSSRPRLEARRRRT